jgi:peptidylprolyl isomerase
MKFFALVGVIALIFGLAACGGGGSSTEARESTNAAATTVELLKPKAKPALAIPKGPPPEQLVIRDLKVGSGPPAKVGDELTAEYTGFNYVNHEEFTNHAHAWGKGEPLVFELGAGEVIKGMDQGLQGMKVGGRRELIIPPDLAYGNVSPPPEVGPDEAVIYVVELLGIG